MSLPLPTPLFARMATVSPAGTAISDLIDAIYLACSPTTDYRGTTLPAANQWTWAEQSNLAAYATAPGGTSLGLAPTIIFAGSTGAPTPTMLTPDSFSASTLLAGIVKNSGAWNAWDNAAPATSGTFSGYWKAGPTSLNAIATKVTAYIAEEMIILDIYSSATAHSIIIIGAIMEPQTSYANSAGSRTAESDDRVYGMITPGSTTSVDTGWLSTSAGWPSHIVTASRQHAMVWQPGTSTVWAMGRWTSTNTSTVANTQDFFGSWCGDRMQFNRTTANSSEGFRIGHLRGVYPIGLERSGKTLRSGGTDLYHIIGVDTSSQDDAFMIPAVP